MKTEWKRKSEKKAMCAIKGIWRSIQYKMYIIWEDFMVCEFQWQYSVHSRVAK